MSYPSKNELVQGRQLKTRRLVIPVLITGHATPANKSVSYDEPALMFLKLEGTGQDHITLARGAVDSAGELSAITFASVDDSDGILSVLVRCGEAIDKVCSVKLVKRNGAELVVGTAPTGATQFITSGGDKVVANFDTATDLSAGNLSCVIEIEYVAQN
jgi:hypothetical protein